MLNLYIKLLKRLAGTQKCYVQRFWLRNKKISCFFVFTLKLKDWIKYQPFFVVAYMSCECLLEAALFEKLVEIKISMPSSLTKLLQIIAFVIK